MPGYPSPKSMPAGLRGNGSANRPSRRTVCSGRQSVRLLCDSGKGKVVRRCSAPLSSWRVDRPVGSASSRDRRRGILGGKTARYAVAAIAEGFILCRPAFCADRGGRRMSIGRMRRRLRAGALRTALSRLAGARRAATCAQGEQRRSARCACGPLSEAPPPGQGSRSGCLPDRPPQPRRCLPRPRPGRR